MRGSQVADPVVPAGVVPPVWYFDSIKAKEAQYPIILHVSRPKDRYELTAFQVTEAEQEKAIAGSFKDLAKVSDVWSELKKPQSTGTRAALDKAQATPEFAALRQTVASGGVYNSLGLVYGGAGSVVVGGESFVGGLMGVAQAGDYYGITSADVTIGAQEGAVGFVGLYLSTEKPADVGGIDFLAELALDLGVGVALEAFWSFSGGSGLVVMATTGEEVEASLGVGDTTTAKL
jgi:hypothetical protein